MPVTGRKPKPDGQAVNRNKSAHDWTEVVDAAFSGGPKLTAKMPNGMPWSSTTRRWWAAVSTMPHCSLWSDSDWQFALDTAFVAGIFHMQGSNVYATELRNREKVLGTTEDYRRGLRIRYIEAKTEATAENVTSMDDYRNL